MLRNWEVKHLRSVINRRKSSGEREREIFRDEIRAEWVIGHGGYNIIWVNGFKILIQKRITDPFIKNPANLLMTWSNRPISEKSVDFCYSYRREFKIGMSVEISVDI